MAGRRGRCGFPSPARTGLLLALAACLGGPEAAAAQSTDLAREIQESRRRLEEIRAERQRLEREMSDVRTRARDVSQQLANIERRLSASRSVLAEIDFQAEAAAVRIRANNQDLIRTRERLRESTAILRRRLRDIYKLGNLHSVRVLLGAESFADLLNRYRYLSLVATYDRALVERISELEQELVAQDRELQESLSELGRLRQSKLGEVAELRSVESERQRALEEFRTREERARGRLAQLEGAEENVRALVEELETRRREAARRRAAAGRDAADASIAAGDAGSLEWPVEGPLVYRFGRERRPNGTVLRWNGIGIGAAAGTPVRAVRAGEVVLAGPFQGYGPTVVLSHGDGFYTLYLYLEEIGVVEGRSVEAGQVVGTVGGRETPEGPHMEFQVRAPGEDGTPRAQDPLRWLRARSGR